MRTFVYVDGFNLYYGSLKGSPHRWLDLFALAGALMPPECVIASVRFCTAKVRGRGDPNRPTRQQAYWNALRATGVEIVEGHFLEHVVSMRTESPPPTTVRVWKTEEKGSDVNLASLLMRDAFTSAFDRALVISNDSDLALPVRLVRDEARLPIRVAFPITNPGRKRSVQLQQAATDFRDLRLPALAACQLPNPVNQAAGQYHKPSGW